MGYGLKLSVTEGRFCRRTVLLCPWLLCKTARQNLGSSRSKRSLSKQLNQGQVWEARTVLRPLPVSANIKTGRKAGRTNASAERTVKTAARLKRLKAQHNMHKALLTPSLVPAACMTNSGNHSPACTTAFMARKARTFARLKEVECSVCAMTEAFHRLGEEG